jgi:hypothetical protein
MINELQFLTEQYEEKETAEIEKILFKYRGKI